MESFSLVMRKAKDKKPAYFQLAISPRLSRYDSMGSETLSPLTHSRGISDVHNFLRFGTPADTIVHVPLSVARLNQKAQQDLTRSHCSFESLLHSKQPLRRVAVLEGKDEYINAINSLSLPVDSFENVFRNRPAFCITNDLSESEKLRTEIQKRAHMTTSINVGLSAEAQSSRDDFLRSVQQIQGKSNTIIERAKRQSIFKSFSRSKGLDYFEAVKSGNVQLVKSFLTADKKLVHVKDSVGQTAMHWAAKRNDVAMARILKVAGAEIDAVDMTLRTPLFMAARADMFDMVAFLLEAGANKNTASLNGKTPSTVAKEGGVAWALFNRRTLNPLPTLQSRKQSSISKTSDV